MSESRQERAFIDFVIEQLLTYTLPTLTRLALPTLTLVDESGGRRSTPVLLTELLDQTSIADIGDLVDSIQSFDKLNPAINRRLSIAQGIIGHDLRNIIMEVTAVQIARKKRQSQPVDTFAHLAPYKNLGPRMTLLRHLCFGIAYIASNGDSRNIEILPATYLPHLFVENGVECIAPVNQINTLDICAIWQLYKNAKDYDVKVKIQDIGGTRVVQVSDNGPGLRDKRGQPLRRNKWHTIFGDYTTKRHGGLGLQVVNELMAFTNGQIYVESITARKARETGCTFTFLYDREKIKK